MLPHTAMRAPSGRYYVRHSSGMGTVMHTNILGEWKKILILDKRYWQEYDCHSNTNNITQEQVKKWSLDLRKFSMNYFHPMFEDRRISTLFLSQMRFSSIHQHYYSDDYFNRTYSFLESDSSRQDCNNWIESIKNNFSEENQKVIFNSSPISYCRSIEVNGVPCDLPNIHVLMRMYADEVILIFMDPCFRDFKFKKIDEIYNLNNLNMKRDFSQMEHSLWNFINTNHPIRTTSIFPMISSTFPLIKSKDFGVKWISMGLYPIINYVHQFYPLPQCSYLSYHSIPILELN